MMNTAFEISEYILSKTPMSNLRLQKILYFIQGESYRKFNFPAFDDNIAAWKHGPVVPEVYNKFCVYGGSNISLNEDVSLEDATKEIVDSVVAKCKDRYVWDLVQETHKSGTPWDKIYNTYGDKTTIPKQLIREYFTQGRVNSNG